MSLQNNHPPLNERSQHLLKVLVERYIRDGQPVGSRTLAEETVLNLSPATIRHVLADLEEHGYLLSPHTSAGRVPTARGYRLFVDGLLTVKPLDDSTVKQCQQQLKPDLNVQGLVSTASNLLSDVTRLTGLVMLPRRDHVTLRHVEFLPLNDNRVLVILVLNEQEVQNRIIYTDRVYSAAELQQAANYLNEVYAGCDVSQLRTQLLQAMQNDREHLNNLMQATVDVASKMFDKPKNSAPDYVMAGQENLLDLADGATGINRLRQLFATFTQKRDILYLLDQCLNAEGIQIFIGEEAGYEVMDECSLVAAPYSVEGKVVGVLGVIGPTRMPYERVISIVDVTAKLLSVALSQKGSDLDLLHDK